MNKLRICLVAMVALLSLPSCGRQAVRSPVPAVAADYDASLVRTRYGIPHVTAQDWGSLGYGYGYAVAEDNLCTLADAIVTVRGERSRYFGGEAGAAYPSTLEEASNLDSDFFFRFVMDDATISGFREAQEAEFQRMLSGYAAGYSRYVAEIKAGGHPGRHASCREQPWVVAIDSNDLYRRAFTALLALSETRLINAIARAQPPVGGKPVAAALSQSPLLPDIDPTRLGSNAIAFGGDATGTAHGLLFGNPHWLWLGMDRFYQVQLQIPGTLDVQGVSFLGIPAVLIGFNRDVAWSHTVSTARRATLYRLQLAKDDPTAYVYDGQVRHLQPSVVSVPVRQADGSIATTTRTLYRSHFGPMLSNGWDGAHAVSVRAVNAGNTRAFRNWMRWARAGSLDEFIRIQKEEAGIPWVNTIAAGRNDDRAWYADIGAIPNVGDAKFKACAVDEKTLDGSRADCEWDNAADSPVPGAMPVSQLPSLLRKDYVANMNDSFWLANPQQPLTGYPRIIGASGEAQSYRTRMGLTLIRQRLQGDDGLPGTRASSETIRQMVLNSRSMSAEVHLDEILEGPCKTASGDARRACRVLAGWDRHGNLDSRGAQVWDAFWTVLPERVPKDERYGVPFDPTDPVGTPRSFNVGHAGVMQALADSAHVLDQGGIALDAPLRDYQALSDADGSKIPLAGGCGSSGYFSVVCTQFGEKGATVRPHGNSYMQVVGFNDEGPEAWTLMLPSEASDPASPYFRDGTRAYSEKRWYRTPFEQAEVEAEAVARIRLQGS